MTIGISCLVHATEFSFQGDSVHFFQGESVNSTTARVDDVTFDITGVQPKQSSTPLKTSSERGTYFEGLCFKKKSYLSLFIPH